jgi:uncharacterized protein
MTTHDVAHIPVVNYLVLDSADPHLVAWRCSSCAALFLDRRMACPACTSADFTRHRLANRGTLRAFTIVHRSPTSAPTPFVAGIVDLAGGGVLKAHIVGVPPDPAQLRPGMPVRLTTFSLGFDSEGTEAIGFGFQPNLAEDDPLPAKREI